MADISICARELYTLKGDESDGCRKTPLCSTRMMMFFFSTRFDVTCCSMHNPVFRCSKQRVKILICCYCTWIEYRNISIDRYNHVDIIFF